MKFYIENIPNHIWNSSNKVLLAKDIKPATETIITISNELIDNIWLLIKLGLENDGIGFAATQTGIQKKLFVIEDPTDLSNPCWIPYINPSYYRLNSEMDCCLEGCLSVPDAQISVSRPKNIVGQWKGITSSSTNNPISLKHKREKLNPLFGRCFQHEHDHLMGISILDKSIIQP